jgi:hypothetical protein
MPPEQNNPQASSPQDNSQVIQSVLNDPDFHAMTPKGQKDFLAQHDPDFGKLSDRKFDETIERLAPAAYAQAKRPAAGPKTKVEPTSDAGTVRAASGIVELGKGIADQLGAPMAILNDPETGRPMTGKKIWDSTLNFGKGLTDPFRQLTDRPDSEFQRYLQSHPEANKEGGAKEAWKSLNFTSALFGGDPDQAWRDFGAGMYTSGLASMFTVPAATIGAGKLLKKVVGGSESSEATGRHAVKEDESLAAMIGKSQADRTPIYGEVHDNLWIAQQVRPLLKQWLQESGYVDQRSLEERVVHPDFFSESPATKSMKGRFTGSFPVRRGAKWFQRVEPAFDAQGNPTGKFVSNIRAGARRALEASSGAVDIADRPFRKIAQEYAADSIKDIKPKIIDDLMNSAAEEEKAANPQLARALYNLADRVDDAKNIGELNDIKITANKKIKGALSGVPGKTIGASADTIYAWKIAADSIRQFMYPKLSEISGVDLRQYGAREAAAIRFRDGIHATYFADVDPSQAAEVAKGYLGNLEHGSLWERHVAKRALRFEREPAGEFNLWFKQGVGKLGEGATGEKVEVAPVEQKALPSSSQAPIHRVYGKGQADSFSAVPVRDMTTSSPGEPMFRVNGGIPQELITPYERSTRMEYAGTREVPNPSYEPFEPSSHKGRTGVGGDPAFHKDYYTPPKERKLEIGPKGSITPDRSFTGSPTKRETVWQMIPETSGGDVSRVGPGTMYTTDPQMAYQAMKRLQDYVARAGGGRNITPYAALPSDLQQQIQNSIADLDRQLTQYSAYRGAKPPRRVKITPAKSGRLDKPRRVGRYAGAAVAGQSAPKEDQKEETETREEVNR